MKGVKTESSVTIRACGNDCLSRGARKKATERRSSKLRMMASARARVRSLFRTSRVSAARWSKALAGIASSRLVAGEEACDRLAHPLRLVIADRMAAVLEDHELRALDQAMDLFREFGR